MGLVHPLTLPNGVKTHTTGFPVAMTGYAFEIYRAPPKLGEHTDEVFAEWLGDEDARARGTLIHLLLEHLPQIPEATRHSYGTAILNAAPEAAGLNGTEALLDDVLRDGVSVSEAALQV